MFLDVKIYHRLSSVYLSDRYFMNMNRINTTGSKLIYFCGSMRAGRQDVDVYAKLIDKISRS